MTTDPADVTLAQRGERRIVARFADARLRKLFGEVWRRLPADAVDRIYAALGDGERVLLATDHNPSNRPTRTNAHVDRVAAGVRLFMDYYHTADASPALVRYLAAHELAHVVAGHLGAPPRNEFDLTPSMQLEVMRRLPPQPMTAYYTAAEVPNEESAEALAERWGFPEPKTLAARRRKSKGKHISEWTKRQ